VVFDRGPDSVVLFFLGFGLVKFTLGATRMGFDTDED